VVRAQSALTVPGQGIVLHMGFVGILREHLPTEPCQQVGGISFCGAAASQTHSNGTPLGFPRPPMPVARGVPRPY
jgi:hypothetical protein